MPASRRGRNEQSCVGAFYHVESRGDLMITYSRTSWYGLGYLFRFKGSVLPRCIPVAVIACVLNWLTFAGYLDSLSGDSDRWLTNHYTVQNIGIVFGFLTVTRITMSYNRYWEGVAMVKSMHSKSHRCPRAGSAAASPVPSRLPLKSAPARLSPRHRRRPDQLRRV